MANSGNQPETVATGDYVGVGVQRKGKGCSAVEGVTTEPLGLRDEVRDLLLLLVPPLELVPVRATAESDTRHTPPPRHKHEWLETDLLLCGFA